MFPELMPHPKHALALELMHEFEREARALMGGKLFTSRTAWRYHPDQIRKWLLIICNTYQGTDFEGYVQDWLQFVSQLGDRPGPRRQSAAARRRPDSEVDDSSQLGDVDWSEVGSAPHRNETRDHEPDVSISVSLPTEVLGELFRRD